MVTEGRKEEISEISVAKQWRPEHLCLRGHTQKKRPMVDVGFCPYFKAVLGSYLPLLEGQTDAETQAYTASISA